MTREPIAAVIFDCDGTLVDSEVPSLDVLHQLACAQGLQLTREQAHERFRGARMAQCVDWIGAQLGNVPANFSHDFTLRVRETSYLRFAQGLDAMSGAHELLSRLRCPFCVATNGPREKVTLSLGVSGLLRYFGDRVFCAYEVGSFKPDPGLFLHAAAALGVAPARCAVVEDSIPGMQAGIDAGMQVFTLHPRQGVAHDMAERVVFIETLSALTQHFPGLLAP